MFLIYKENHLILVKMKKETWKYFLLKKKTKEKLSRVKRVFLSQKDKDRV